MCSTGRMSTGTLRDENEDLKAAVRQIAQLYAMKATSAAYRRTFSWPRAGSIRCRWVEAIV